MSEDRWTIYAIQSLEGRRVFIGVTTLPLAKRLARHAAADTNPAFQLLNEDHRVRVLEAGLTRSQRNGREAGWDSGYREQGWDVLSITQRAINLQRMRAVNETLTSEQRAAGARKTIGDLAMPRWLCAHGCEPVYNAGNLARHQQRTQHEGRVPA